MARARINIVSESVEVLKSNSIEQGFTWDVQIPKTDRDFQLELEIIGLIEVALDENRKLSKSFQDIANSRMTMNPESDSDDPDENLKQRLFRELRPSNLTDRSEELDRQGEAFVTQENDLVERVKFCTLDVAVLKEEKRKYMERQGQENKVISHVGCYKMKVGEDIFIYDANGLYIDKVKPSKSELAFIWGGN